MDDEIEDIVGDVKYTDSQKSINTLASAMYSADFTDCESRTSVFNNSLGKETYVLEWDSDSEKTFPLHDSASAVSNNLFDGPFPSVPECLSAVSVNIIDGRFTSIQCGTSVVNTRATSTSFHQCSVIAQEIYTQTSKTIIELAETETTMKRALDSNTLETQTSFMSITENKTIEYKIEVGTGSECFAKGDTVTNFHEITQSRPRCYTTTYNYAISNSIDDSSSKFPASETENGVTEDSKSETSSNDQLFQIVDDVSKETIPSQVENQVQTTENNSELDEPTSDMEVDSLMGDKPNDEVNDDIKELRDKLAENLELCMPDRYDDSGELRRFGTLTPLSEESNARKESLMEINAVKDNTDATKNPDEVLFTSNTGMKVKLLNDNEKSSFKLPPIKNRSCPNSPHLNCLFGKPKLNKSGTLPSLYERQDRWEINNKSLASGESPDVKKDRSESPIRCNVSMLPPIHGDMPCLSATDPTAAAAEAHDAISIKDRIKELKMSSKKRLWAQRRVESRSVSPCSAASPDESRLCDVADRGCEALCTELLRRLRSSSWHEVIETLDEVPRVLEKFWGVITEYRIADLVRQMTAHVESPRPQVARTACGAVAYIIKNTNYTKKPDFYESVTTLLTKTGSYSRPVRRAANVALDDIVCGVDFVHSVAALCVHGVGHKNGLVRCAAARLLVVCCALAGGGRELLRGRPASAAAARRHALRALAALLEDKSTDTRKYAERLYSMLRPLSNFEAYYLTDVDVELASRQMKKYDQLLLCGPPKNGR